MAKSKWEKWLDEQKPNDLPPISSGSKLDFSFLDEEDDLKKQLDPQIEEIVEDISNNRPVLAAAFFNFNSVYKESRSDCEKQLIEFYSKYVSGKDYHIFHLEEYANKVILPRLVEYAQTNSVIMDKVKPIYYELRKELGEMVERWDKKATQMKEKGENIFELLSNRVEFFQQKIDNWDVIFEYS